MAEGSIQGVIATGFISRNYYFKFRNSELYRDGTGWVRCHLDKRGWCWNNEKDREQKTAKDPFSFPLCLSFFFSLSISLSLPLVTQEKVGKQIMASFSYDGRFRRSYYWATLLKHVKYSCLLSSLNFSLRFPCLIFPYSTANFNLLSFLNSLLIICDFKINVRRIANRCRWNGAREGFREYYKPWRISEYCRTSDIGFFVLQVLAIRRFGLEITTDCMKRSSSWKDSIPWFCSLFGFSS